MIIQSFEALHTKLQQLYADEKYREALNLATEYTDQFPEQAHLLEYWRSTMAARIGDTEQALSILSDVLDSGFWYGEVLLRKSPSYQNIQGNPEFEELVSFNRELQRREQENTLNLLTIRGEGKCLDEDEPCSLLVGLHANASNSQETIDFWRAAATLGWLVAVPQSTQAMWKGAFIWDDRETSTREVKHYFNSLTGQYYIDQDRTILAGHSMGGEIAAWLSLTGEVICSGFILFGPGGPFMDEPGSWMSIIDTAAESGIRGYIIMGEDDHKINQDNVRKFSTDLNRANIACELELVPGVGHDYVPEYDSSLLRGLSFITE